MIRIKTFIGKYIYLAVFLLSLFFINCNTKTKSLQIKPYDSLGVALDSGFRMSQRGEETASINYIKSILNRKRLNYFDQYWLYSFIADNYTYRIRNNDSAKYYWRLMLSFIDDKEINDTINQMRANVYNGLGIIYNREQNFDSPIMYYDNGLEILKDSKDSIFHAIYLRRIAMTYYQQELYEKASCLFIESLICLQPSIANLKEQNINRTKDNNYFRDTYIAQEVIDNIGLCYYNLRNYDTAIYYYRKCIDFINCYAPLFPINKEGWQGAKGVVFDNIATSFEAIKKDDSALYYYQQSLSISDSLVGDNFENMSTKIKLFNFYVKNKNLAKAKILYNDIESLVKNSTLSHHDKLRLLFATSQYYQLTGAKELAYDYLIQWKLENEKYEIDLNKSVNNQLLENINQYESDLKIKELKIKALSTNQRFIFFSGFMLLIILIFICYFYFNQRLMKQLQSHIEAKEILLLQLENEKKTQEVLANKFAIKNLEKDFLIRSVVHDLLNPLAGIMLNIEIHELKQSISQSHDDLLNKIKGMVSNMIIICNDMIDFSSNKTFNLTFVIDNLIKTVSEAVENIKPITENKKQTVNILTENNNEIISSYDSEKIIRLLVNLLNNASKFSKVGGQIDIHIFDQKNKVIIKVSDHGVGMPVSILDKIFSQQEVVGSLGTSGEKSNGIGLYICKQIVTAHNGIIEVDSKLGEGTSFTITLPKHKTID